MVNRQWNSSLKPYSLERTLAYYCHIIMGQVMNIGKALYKIAPLATDVLTYFGENLSFSQFNTKLGSLNSLLTAVTFNQDKPGHSGYVWYRRCHNE